MWCFVSQLIDKCIYLYKLMQNAKRKICQEFHKLYFYGWYAFYLSCEAQEIPASRQKSSQPEAASPEIPELKRAHKAVCVKQPWFLGAHSGM